MNLQAQGFEHLSPYHSEFFEFFAYLEAYIMIYSSMSLSLTRK